MEDDGILVDLDDTTAKRFGILGRLDQTHTNGCGCDDPVKCEHDCSLTFSRWLSAVNNPLLPPVHLVHSTDHGMTYYTPHATQAIQKEDMADMNLEALKRLIFTTFRMYNKDPIVAKKQIKRGRSIIYAGMELDTEGMFTEYRQDEDTERLSYRFHPKDELASDYPTDIYERIWFQLKSFIRDGKWRTGEAHSKVFPEDGKMNPETIQFIVDSIADVYRKLPVKAVDVNQRGEEEEIEMVDDSTNVTISERVNDTIPGAFQLGESELIMFKGEEMKIEKIKITTESLCDLATEIAVMQSSISPNLKRFDALITGKDTVYRIVSNRYIPYSFSTHSTTIGHAGELFAAVQHVAMLHPKKDAEKRIPHAYVHGHLTPDALYFDQHKQTIALGDFKDLIGFEYFKGKARRVSGPESHRFCEGHDFLPKWNPPTFDSGDVFCGGEYVAYLNWDLRGLAFAMLSISLGYEAAEVDMNAFLEKQDVSSSTPTVLDVLIQSCYRHSENSKVWCLPVINHQLALSRQIDS